MQFVARSLFCVSQVSRSLQIIRSSASRIQIKFGTGISRVGFSESPILPNIVGTSFQFRATCSFDVRRFYSTKNSIQNLNRGHLGSVSFIDIVGSPYFVDKTLFIQKVLECGSKHMLITAPRRFGKSVNLDMLRCFFENRDHYDLFSRLKIGHTPAMDYCGEFPVIWLNFKVAGAITSEEDAVAACRRIIRGAFLRHEILVTSTKLTESKKNYCKVWCDPLKYKSFDREDVLEGLTSLAEYLYLHYGKKSMLLVDEFDAICTGAFSEVDAVVLNRIIEFYSSMLSNVIKSNKDFVERSIITGITRIMSSGLSGAINNVIDYSFSEKPYFCEFYGVTELEFDELMNRECAATLQHLKEEALKYYNGYTWNDQRLLNTWSVMNFLERKKLKPYWVQSGFVEPRPENTCKNEIVRNCIVKLVKGDTINTDRVEFGAKNFKSFVDDFSQVEKKKVTNISPLLWFYFQQGYLTMVSSTVETVGVKKVGLKIPNREVKTVYLESLISYFEIAYRIERTFINEAADLLQKFDPKNEDECRSTLSSIGRIIEKMSNQGIYNDTINEAIFHEFMFAILYWAGFEPTSEIEVHRYSRERYDICARISDGIGILIEFKVNESADKALQIILDKVYFAGLMKRNIFTDYVLVGMSLRKKKETNENTVSISFLRNSLNIKDKIEIDLEKI